MVRAGIIINSGNILMFLFFALRLITIDAAKPMRGGGEIVNNGSVFAFQRGICEAAGSAYPRIGAAGRMSSKLDFLPAIAAIIPMARFVHLYFTGSPMIAYIVIRGLSADVALNPVAFFVIAVLPIVGYMICVAARIGAAADSTGVRVQAVVFVRKIACAADVAGKDVDILVFISNAFVHMRFPIRGFHAAESAHCTMEIIPNAINEIMVSFQGSVFIAAMDTYAGVVAGGKMGGKFDFLPAIAAIIPMARFVHLYFTGSPMIAHIIIRGLSADVALNPVAVFVIAVLPIVGYMICVAARIGAAAENTGIGMLAIVQMHGYDEAAYIAVDGMHVFVAVGVLGIDVRLPFRHDLVAIFADEAVGVAVECIGGAMLSFQGGVFYAAVVAHSGIGAGGVVRFKIICLAAAAAIVPVSGSIALNDTIAPMGAYVLLGGLTTQITLDPVAIFVIAVLPQRSVMISGTAGVGSAAVYTGIRM